MTGRSGQVVVMMVMMEGQVRAADNCKVFPEARDEIREAFITRGPVPSRPVPLYLWTLQREGGVEALQTAMEVVMTAGVDAKWQSGWFKWFW